MKVIPQSEVNVPVIATTLHWEQSLRAGSFPPPPTQRPPAPAEVAAPHHQTALLLCHGTRDRPSHFLFEARSASHSLAPVLWPTSPWVSVSSFSSRMWRPRTLLSLARLNEPVSTLGTSSLGSTIPRQPCVWLARSTGSRVSGVPYMPCSPKTTPPANGKTWTNIHEQEQKRAQGHLFSVLPPTSKYKAPCLMTCNCKKAALYYHTDTDKSRWTSKVSEDHVKFLKSTLCLCPCYYTQTRTSLCVRTLWLCPCYYTQTRTSLCVRECWEESDFWRWSYCVSAVTSGNRMGRPRRDFLFLTRSGAASVFQSAVMPALSLQLGTGVRVEEGQRQRGRQGAVKPRRDRDRALACMGEDGRCF